MTNRDRTLHRPSGPQTSIVRGTDHIALHPRAHRERHLSTVIAQ
jgi:hypothetical protein